MAGKLTSGEFVARPRVLPAIQWSGIAGGHEALADWLRETGGGNYEDFFYSPMNQPADRPKVKVKLGHSNVNDVDSWRWVQTGDWVVRLAPDIMGLYSIRYFDECYLPANHGVALIMQERERQISVEGWTPEHDDSHIYGELAMAAACYAMPPNKRYMESYGPRDWPWESDDWKPSDDRVRDLVRAGALIAADIDRELRARSNTPAEPEKEYELHVITEVYGTKVSGWVPLLSEALKGRTPEEIEKAIKDGHIRVKEGQA